MQVAVLYKTISLFIKKGVLKNSNIFIAYGHIRMFQVYRPVFNHDNCSISNRSDTCCHRSCHIRYDNKHVYTTGKPKIFKGSQETLLKRSQKNSSLHRMDIDCVVNTDDVSNGIAGTVTLP